MSQESPASAIHERFLLGHAAANDWQSAVAKCLQQIGYIPAHANCGFLYLSDTFADDVENILAQLRTTSGIKHWTGTVGMGICCTGHEYHDQPAIAVMLASFPEDQFRILPPIRTAEETSLPSLHDWLEQRQLCVGIVQGDPRNNAIPEIIARLADRLPGGFLVGGLSSSRGTSPQIADGVTDGGVSGVLLAEGVPVATGLTQGCSPIGNKHIITECERNLIIKLDDRPALEVFYEDVGEILARDLNRIAGYIFVGLPIQESDTGDYLVRNLIGIDVEHQILAVGDMLHRGQSVQFCRRDGRSAWDDLHRMLNGLKKRITGTPRGGVYYSCLGRGAHLFGEDSEELRTIRDELGDFPLVGFFANGEISNNRLYGYTGVLTLFL